MVNFNDLLEIALSRYNTNCILRIVNKQIIAERQGEKICIQVALRITEKQTMEREFGNLLVLKDNYPRYVITLDEYSGTSFEGIKHVPLREFLFEFT